MSILGIATSAWQAFWASVLSPASLSILLLVFLVCLLAGFAFNRTIGAMHVALRAASLVILLMLVFGIMGALGLGLDGLTPTINWFLELIQFPLYLPE